MVWGTKWQGLYFRNPKIFEFNHNSSSLFISNGANLLEYSVSAGAMISTHSLDSEITGFLQTSLDQALISTLEGELVLWNLKKSQKIKSWKHFNAIYAIVANPSDPNTIYLSVQTQKDTYCIIKHVIDSNTNKEIHSSSTPYMTLYSDFSGHYVISKKGKTLYVWDTVNCRIQRYQHSHKISRICVHPSEPIVATGDAHGHIYYWSLSTNIKSEDFISEFRNISHWHAHTVHSLTFTKDGAYLLSGGEEGVLVICNTESNKSTYLPRLGSTLCELTVSQDAKYYGILLEENSVLLVNSATLRIEHRIQKLRTPYGENNSCIKIDPTTNLVTLNTSSYIQFYNYIQDEFVNEVEISSYLKVRGPNALSESIVDNYQFTSDGTWLCSIEHKKQVPGTSCMKFWKLKNGSKWQLHTRVEEPHKDKIVTLIGHPTIPLFVTISSDKTFKVWSQLDITDANTSTSSKTSVYSWYCRSIGTYKSMLPTTATISKDGSLLAVAFNNIITLWNLNNMMLLKEFPLIGTNDPIVNMDFIFKSPNLAVSTSKKLYMWNLLNFTIQWSFNAKISHLSADTTSNKLVVVVSNKQSNYLLLFTTESCKPICYWKFNESVLSVTFINEKSLQSLHSAASNGILVLVNSLTKPLLLFEEYDTAIPTLDTSSAVYQNKLEENEFSDELPTRGGTSNSNDNMVSKPSKIDLESNSINKNIYHLFDAPTHILPPIPSIYKSFMDILLTKSDSNSALEQITTSTKSNSVIDNNMSDMEVEPQEFINYKGASTKELGSMSDFFSSLQVAEPPNPKTKATTPKKATPVKGNKKQ